MPEISIIIPAYNSKDFISELIESIQAQTFQDWELIIVDDGSSDSTFEVASVYANNDDRIKLSKKRNGGSALARNYGLSMANPSSLYVMTIDHDDYLEPDALQVLRTRLNNQPDMVAAYGLAREVDKDGEKITKRIEDAYGIERLKVNSDGVCQIPDDEPTGFSSFVVWCWIKSNGQVLIRHDAMKSAKFFDPETDPLEDWDMWLRLSLLGDFAFVRRFVINKRTHGDNITEKRRRLSKVQLLIRQKLAANEILDARHRKIAQLGHKQEAYLKFSWAKNRFAQKNYFEAIKDIYRSMRTYYWYVRTPSS